MQLVTCQSPKDMCLLQNCLCEPRQGQFIGWWGQIHNAEQVSKPTASTLGPSSDINLPDKSFGSIIIETFPNIFQCILLRNSLDEQKLISFQIIPIREKYNICLSQYGLLYFTLYGD